MQVRALLTVMMLRVKATCSVLFTPGSGFPVFFSHLKSSFICEVKPHAKFQNPRTNPFGRKDCGGGLLCV
jgi:hypothetical protein